MSDSLYSQPPFVLVLLVQILVWVVRYLSLETCSLLFVFDSPDNMITEEAGQMETWYSGHRADSREPASVSWEAVFVPGLILVA